MSAGVPSLRTAGMGGCGLEEAEKAFLVVQVACAKVRGQLEGVVPRSRCQEARVESRAAGVGSGEPLSAHLTGVSGVLASQKKLSLGSSSHMWAPRIPEQQGR